MTAPFIEICFWTCLVLTGYTFAGYPLLLEGISFFARKRPRLAPATFPDHDLPSVSVVLCVFNGEDRITGRLTNLAKTDYPQDRIEIIVVSDGSTDQTAARAASFPDNRIRPIAEPARRGKAHRLNQALEIATGEIIVFADARQDFAPDAIRKLANAFADLRTGAISGSLEIANAASSTGQGIDLYWRLEKRVRHLESSLGATIGCTGAIYAIRKSLFRPLPPDTLLDDVVVPMTILSAGHRVLFDPSAIALDPQPLEPAQERIRKRRTLAGNYQMLFRYPEWLLPWKNRAWWQLLSHKYLRLAAPWLLLATLLANVALAGQPFYRWLLFGQTALYALATIGLLFPNARSRILSLPAGFAFLNAMAVEGLFSYLRRDAAGSWEPSSPSTAATSGRSDD